MAAAKPWLTFRRNHPPISWNYCDGVAAGSMMDVARGAGADDTKRLRDRAHKRLDWLIDQALTEQLWGKVGVTIDVKGGSIEKVAELLDAGKK